MTRAGRRIAVLLGAAAVATGISVAWSSAGASTPPPAAPDPTSSGSPVQSSPDPGHWTPERMRAAAPAPMPEP